MGSIRKSCRVAVYSKFCPQYIVKKFAKFRLKVAYCRHVRQSITIMSLIISTQRSSESIHVWPSFRINLFILVCFPKYLKTRKLTLLQTEKPWKALPVNLTIQMASPITHTGTCYSHCLKNSEMIWNNLGLSTEWIQTTNQATTLVCVIGDLQKSFRLHFSTFSLKSLQPRNLACWSWTLKRGLYIGPRGLKPATFGLVAVKNLKNVGNICPQLLVFFITSNITLSRARAQKESQKFFPGAALWTPLA